MGDGERITNSIQYLKWPNVARCQLPIATRQPQILDHVNVGWPSFASSLAPSPSYLSALLTTTLLLGISPYLISLDGFLPYKALNGVDKDE